MTLLQSLGKGFAIVDVDGDAEPVKNFAGLVADRLATNPPPAGMAIAGANHAGFQIKVFTGGDGMVPGFQNALPVLGLKRAEPARVSEVFDGEAEIVEEVLVGVGDAPVGSAHPDSLGVEIG